MKHLLLFFFLGWPAGAQTISVPVSRVVNLGLDEAVFTATVGAGLDSTAQQVKQALEEIGFPNPTVVATGLGPDSINANGAAQVYYRATLTLAAGSTRDAARRLDSLRSRLPAPLKSLDYSAALDTSAAAIDTARQSLLPKLLADARTQAQSLAAAAGVNLGPIRAIADAQAGACATPFLRRDHWLLPRRTGSRAASGLHLLHHRNFWHRPINRMWGRPPGLPSRVADPAALDRS